MISSLRSQGPFTPETRDRFVKLGHWRSIRFLIAANSFLEEVHSHQAPVISQIVFAR